MKKRENYNNFKISIEQKIHKAIDDIHIAIRNKNYIFKFLLKHEYIINEGGVDFEKLRSFNKNTLNSRYYINKEIIFTEDNILNDIIHSNLNTFVYLSFVKIDTLLNYINYMTYLHNMSYRVYKELIRGFNLSILETIIDGDNYNFGFGLSSIRIKRVKRKNNKVVNWGESNKKRKLQQTTGGEGEWIIHHESPYYNFVYWNKALSNISNHIFYNFKVTSFINTPDRNINNYYRSITSKDKVINDQFVGALQKVNSCIKFNPELVNIYLNN